MPHEEGSIVTYRKQGSEEPWHKATGRAAPLPYAPHYLLHQVELTDLAPGTTYQFKVLPYTEEALFATAPSTLEQSFSFVEGGDLYHGNRALMVNTCRLAAAQRPLFAVLGGDLAYAVRGSRASRQDSAKWIDWLRVWHETMVTPEKRMIPIIAAIGNHDVIGLYDQTPIKAATFAALFPRPEGSLYRVIDFRHYLSLILLDSGHASPIEGEQTEWLKHVLSQRSGVLYRFPLYHVPAYPSVGPIEFKQSALIRRNWVPLFEQIGIGIVFEHHDHAYKRTYPLVKGEKQVGGVVYIGDGAWGVKKARIPTSRRSYLASFASIRHFFNVTLTPTRAVINAIDDTGQLIDTYEYLPQLNEPLKGGSLKENPKNDSRS